MFSQFSLKTKLLGFSLLSAIMLAVVGGIGYYVLNQTVEKSSFISNVNLPNIARMATMRYFAVRSWGAITRLAITGNPAEVQSEQLKNITSYLEGYEKAEKEYLSIDFLPGEEALFNAMKPHWLKYREMTLHAQKLVESQTKESQDELIRMINGEFTAVRQSHLDELQKLIDYHRNSAAKETAESAELAKKSTWISVFAVAFGFVLTFGLGYAFAQTLTRSIQSVATRLGAGADEISSASQQVASSSEQLSSGATQQAASLQETASSLEELSSMVARNAENSSKSQGLASEARDIAVNGGKAIEKMTGAVNEISHANSELMQKIEDGNAKISEIVKVISEIGNKTKVINDIVFQTKLLSFNASVEAARAGEHGKGFAVVAEEVGNLAQMSGNAAREISVMLDESVKRVESIIHENKAGVEVILSVAKEKVNVGLDVSNRCNEVFQALVDKVDLLNNMAAEVSNASTEQAKGVQEISRAMRQLDQVTQQNASASTQAASAAEEMAGQSQSLNLMVEQLIEVVNGAKTQQARAPYAPRYQSRKEKKNVVPFERAKKSTKIERPAPAPVPRAMASGQDLQVPSEDDPGFRDI